MSEYNPLDYKNLTKSVVNALMESPERDLLSLPSFEGAGVYAVFYKGTLSWYKAIKSSKEPLPIYVGKAVQPGARKGKTQNKSSKSLYSRLKKHQKSITLADNLDPGDFSCRYLVVTPVWITMAERFLIEHYQPIWNVRIDGFGNNDPGGRRETKRSAWDTLHPGRAKTWTGTVINDKTQAEVVSDLQDFLKNHPRLK